MSGNPNITVIVSILIIPPFPYNSYLPKLLDPANGANGMSDMAGPAAKVAVETSGSERDTILNIVPQLIVGFRNQPCDLVVSVLALSLLLFLVLHK